VPDLWCQQSDDHHWVEAEWAGGHLLAVFGGSGLVVSPAEIFIEKISGPVRGIRFPPSHAVSREIGRLVTWWMLRSTARSWEFLDQVTSVPNFVFGKTDNHQCGCCLLIEG
jgi:hypothetical protein